MYNPTRHTPVTKRSAPQNHASSHKACRIGSVDAIDAIAAKARMWPTRRMMIGQA